MRTHLFVAALLTASAVGCSGSDDSAGSATRDAETPDVYAGHWGEPCAANSAGNNCAKDAGIPLTCVAQFSGGSVCRGYCGPADSGHATECAALGGTCIDGLCELPDGG